MRPLSATECISPAIDRTKLLLFSPFRKGRSWKLCATSYLCFVGSIYFPFPLIFLAFIPMVRSAGAIAIAALITVAVLGLALLTWVFHLCSHLQFVYFDMVANRSEFVRPSWRKFRGRVLPFTVLKMALGLGMTAIFATPLAALAPQILPIIKHMAARAPGQPPPPEFLAIFYGSYAIFVLVFGLGMLVCGLLADFLVPSLALENTSLREAFHRMDALIRQEPGQFALYVLLKTVLGLVAYFAAIMLWEIAFFLVTFIVGGAVFVLGFLLHLAGVPTIALTVPGIFLAVVWYIFASIYVLAFAIGPVFTWMEAYAIYFLGGRYPMLGDMLDLSTPPPVAPAFHPYAPAYPPPVPPTA
jgi:hypothetical protein